MRRRRWLNDKTFVCKMLLVSGNRSALVPTPPDDLRHSPAGIDCALAAEGHTKQLEIYRCL